MEVGVVGEGGVEGWVWVEMAGVARCWRVAVMGKGGVVKTTQERGRKRTREDRKKRNGKVRENEVWDSSLRIETGEFEFASWVSEAGNQMPAVVASPV